MNYTKNLSFLSLSLYIFNAYGMENVDRNVDKFALLKSAPLDRITFINIPPNNNLTEQKKKALVLSLCAADNAVTIDTTHSALPLTIDVAQTWFGLEDDTTSEDESLEDKTDNVTCANKLQQLKFVDTNVTLAGLENFDTQTQASILRQLPQILQSLQSVDDAVTINDTDPDQISATIDISKIVSFPLKPSTLGLVQSFLNAQPDDIQIVQGGNPAAFSDEKKRKLISDIRMMLSAITETEEGHVAIDTSLLPEEKIQEPSAWATGSLYSMEAAFSNGVLTLKRPNRQSQTFIESDLKACVRGLCETDPEHIVVVDTRTTDNSIHRIQLTPEETAQFKIALLSSAAQDSPHKQSGKYVIDIAHLQPLPKAVHDLVYGTQQETAPTPASQPVIHREPTIKDRLFNKTTLSACAICAVATWIAAKNLGQSSE